MRVNGAVTLPLLGLVHPIQEIPHSILRMILEILRVLQHLSRLGLLPILFSLVGGLLFAIIDARNVSGLPEGETNVDMTPPLVTDLTLGVIRIPLLVILDAVVALARLLFLLHLLVPLDVIVPLGAAVCLCNFLKLDKERISSWMRHKQSKI